MSATCSYRILPEFKLVLGKYTGTVSEKDIISLKDTIRKDNAFNRDFNILDDFTDADFNLSAGGPEIILHWLQDNFSSSRRSALLTNTPDQVVTITLFKHLEKNKLPMNIQIFSTLASASRWIGISDRNINDIAEVINELKS
jgi:hypothetical protein